MVCSKDAFYRFTDAIFLLGVFLFQSVILNYFIIRHYFNNGGSSLSFLWFLGDFLCLLVFSLTLFLAYRNNYKMRRREKSLNMSSSSSVNSGRTTSRNSNTSDQGLYPTFDCFSQVSKLPFSYISWIVYSIILIAKIVVLFKADIPQTLQSDEFFGPQMVKFAIGVTAIIYSLLVEAHHDAHDDPTRYDYIKMASYTMALEILDSTSFLTILIGSESKLVYTYKMENFIIGLSSINLMLPAIALYKLTVSSFGRTYPVPLGTLYKVLHLLLVNVPYFGFRAYIWQMFGSDVSIFIIKNIYSITSFLREMLPEFQNLRLYFNGRSRLAQQRQTVITKGKAEEVPMGNTRDSVA